MLWGSTCRAVTSFRPYELVNRLGNAYICQSNAYAYRPPYRYTCRMRISADRSIERRPTVHLHRTLAPYCYHAGTTLPPTIDRAAMPTIYKTTGSADTPATTTDYRSCRYACDPRPLLAPYCHTLDNDSADMPAITHQTMTVLFCLQSNNDRAVTPTIYQPTDRRALCSTSIVTAAGTVLPPRHLAAMPAAQ
jgi:hypothetical protein